MTNHLILKILHKIASKFHTSKLQKEELHYINDANLAAKNIVNLLLSEKPCMIARFGSIELTVIVRYLGMLKYKSKYMSYILGETPNWWWEKNLMKSIQNNAGFINPTPENLKKFSVRMMEDMQLVDILGSWCKEELLFKAELNNALKVRLRYLEPFWGDSPWTKALKDKKVLIIHPFAETVMKQYEKREEFNRDFLEKLNSYQVDLVVLAGFLVVLPEMMIKQYENRIINIHPSLIPSFCGKGFYGLKVHEEALARGVKVTGATVHFVDAGTDTGPIILQKAVAVQEGDTPKILQQRVMEQAEWQIMPQAIDLIANGKVSVVDGHVQIAE